MRYLQYSAFFNGCQYAMIMAEVIGVKNRQIVFTGVNCAELLEVDMTAPTGDQVQVRLAVSTVSSGTERANISGDVNVSAFEVFTQVSFPRYAGYSAAGTVVAVGDKVTRVAVGDRVVVSWGTHSAYSTVPECDVTKIEDDSLSFEEAALTHIGTFPLGAIRKCRLEVGESALVMGLGVLGLMAVQQLRAAGAVPVIAADPIPVKRELALRLGADYDFDPLASDFAAQVKAVTGKGANVVIEVTGLGAGLDTALDATARMGRVALLGCTRSSDFTIDYYRKVHGPGISLIGAHTHARPEVESAAALWTTQDDVRAQLRLVAGGRIDLKTLVEETHSPEEAPAVYQRLVTEKSFPIVQFDWRLL